MARRHPNVANLDEVEAMDTAKAFNRSEADLGVFGAKFRRLADATGGRSIGCSFFEVAPGRTAYPFHWHLANEEALIVVSGEGTLRIGDAEVAVRGGDYVAFPVGLAHAHQLKNTGDEPLRYYCISTLLDPEVCGYPDSKKIGTLSRKGPLRFVFREDDNRDYFDREPLAGKK